MRKYGKQLLSLMLSLLMVLTALPLSALAATGNLPFLASGIYMYNCTADRFSSNTDNGYYNIVNDQQDDNFTMAFFKWDVSRILEDDITVTEAVFDIQLQSNPMGDCQGLTFFYCNNNRADNFANGAVKTTESNIFGSTGTHLANAKNYFNLVELQTFNYGSATWTAGYNFSVNIADAINATVAAGRTTCVIMVAQKQAGGKGSNGGWTDTKLKYGSYPMTYSYEVADVNDYISIGHSKCGIITKSDDRYDTSNKTFNIVNDAQDGNFTIGFWQYDVRTLYSETGDLESATMRVDMPSQSSDREWNGITFYYARNYSNANNLSEGINNNVGSVYGTDGQHLSKSISYYNLKSLYAVPPSSLSGNGTRFEFDISEAILAAQAANEPYVTIMVLQSQTGQSGSSGGWTDTKLRYDNVTVNCCFAGEVVVDASIEALNAAIADYETKMAKIKTNDVPYVYTNMKAAYDAYIVACRYRDASVYGFNEAATADFATATGNLNAALNNMKVWSNQVSAKANVLPTFTDSSQAEMQPYAPKLIQNIVYTTNVTGTAKNNNLPTGYAACSDHNNFDGLSVAVYYPTATVVLFDGISTPKIPVMMSAKNEWTTGDKTVYTVYPATNATGKTDRSDIYMINKHNRMSDISYSWRGSGGCGSGTFSCDFDYSQEHPVHTVGVDANNTVNGHTCSHNNYWTAGDFRNLTYYSSALVIDDNFDFGGAGMHKWVDIPWYFKGGSISGHGAIGSGVSGNNGESNWTLTGLLNVKNEDHAIYAINYKAVLSSLKNNDLKNTLAAANSYKAGGLGDLLALIDEATSLSITSSDFAGNTESKVAAVGQNIERITTGIDGATPVSDVDSYENLRNAIVRTTPTFNLGNPDYSNYSQESWDIFDQEYRAAVQVMSDLYTSPYRNQLNSDDVAYSDEYATRLNIAYDNLVLVKAVVDTSVLDIVLGNADAIVNSVSFFNEATIASSNIEYLVEQCKIAVWGSEDGYGLDANKLDDTPQNQQIVDGYVVQLANAINLIVLNKQSEVPGTNMSLESAIEAADSYAPNKNDYSNYAILEAAANNAKNLYNSNVSIDPYVKDQAQNTIDRYVNYVNEINIAIKQLAPSFSKIENGTVANVGRVETTVIGSSVRPDMWNLTWYHNTDVAFFKTERDPATFELPRSEMELYCGQTDGDYWMLLDSINLNSSLQLPDGTDTPTGEIKSTSVIKSGADPDYALNQAQIDEHPGGLSIMNANITLYFDSIVVTQKSAYAYGKERNGNDVIDPTHNFVEELSNTDGTKPASGGIMAVNGSTKINCHTLIDVPATSGSPTVVTQPSKKSLHFNSNQANAHLGYLAYWKFSNNIFARQHGYYYDHALYNQNIHIIDLCTLFDIIGQVEDMAPQANLYTNTSWNNLMTMLSNAKADMNYSAMSYDKIIEACDKRYNDLWEAKEIGTEKGLKYAASNVSLKNAIEACEDVYPSARELCSESSWTAFENAYRNASSAYSGIYSATGVRDYGQEEQPNIDALANALVDAKNALDYLINFDVVDAAADALIKSIEPNKYTLASVNSIRETLANLPCLNMSKAERLTHYESETDIMNALRNEAEQIIPNLKSSLVLAESADEVLNEVKRKAKESYKDPDAYNIDNIDLLIQSVSAYIPVEFPDYINENGYTYVRAVQYATQEEADLAVKDALSRAKIQQYTVSRVNPDGSTTNMGTYDYGTEISVESKNNDNVDWYYESVSNTTSSNRKYFSTGDEVTFIVKGNTVLRTEKPQGDDVYKVEFVNALNGKPYDIKYVSSGTQINLSNERSKVPDIGCFVFKNFTSGDSAVSNITVTSNLTIKANYEYDSTLYNITVFNLSGWGPVVLGDTTATQVGDEIGYGYVGDGVKYNDRISFTADNYYNYENYAPNDDYYDTFIFEINRVPQYFNTGYRYQDEVAAWAKLDVSDVDMQYDEILDALANCTFESKSEIENKVPGIKADIIKYGSDYTFYAHENCFIVALTENQLSSLSSDDVIEKDYTIMSSPNPRVNGDSSISIVSTYCIPQGAKAVESGILFIAKKNAVPVVESMTLSDATSGSKISRIKSTLHTVADQFVITVGLPAGKTYYTKYRAYVTYEYAGKTTTVYSDIVDYTANM